MYLPTTTAIKQRVTFTEDSLSAAHSTQYFMSVISFNLPNNDYKAGSTPIPCLEAGKLIHREVRWPAHGCLTNWWRGGIQTLLTGSVYVSWIPTMHWVYSRHGNNPTVSGSQLSVCPRMSWKACQHTGCCPRVSDWVSLGWIQKICLPNNLSGVGGLGTHSECHWSLPSLKRKSAISCVWRYKL